jgi:hypothetical protein
MNERLREIAIKAQVEHCISHVRLVEFAELIVRKCASRVDNILREKKDGGGTMGDDIREHFGVEE